LPVVQIRGPGRDWATLEQDLNPFAVVVMAHLKAREVRDGTERKQWKLRLLRGLYERGYNREEILTLFRFIDWLLVSPAALEQEFWHEFRQFEEEKHMPYVTSVERRGFEQGLQQGLQQGQLQEAQEMLLEAVAARFGEVPEDVTAAVQRLETVEPLRGLLHQALTSASLAAFREALHTVQG
jgi:flagellar biosynthesis/type III secretory pathway protein FliH